MNRSGRGLVGMLVAVCVVVAGSAMFAVGGGMFGEKVPERADGQGKTLVGRAALRAKDGRCMETLQQVRQAVEIGTDAVEDTKPASLDELRLPASLLQCPVGGERYEYDPASGKARCPHPGHEKY
jgi:hypothetical protein